MKNILLPVILLTVLINNLSAQESTVTAGGKASGTNGSSSYSIGQIVFEDVATTGGTTLNGVQQPFEIFIVTSVGNLAASVKAIVFPNPSTDRVILKIDNPLSNKYSYSLYNSNGILLANNKVLVSSTEIALTTYSKGVYILEVQSRGQKIKSFKIVKTK
jgi:Secretion system C-terminal sorting domain